MARTMTPSVAMRLPVEAAAGRKRPGASAPACRATAGVFEWIAAAEAAQRTWARNMLLVVGGAVLLMWLLSRVFAT